MNTHARAFRHALKSNHGAALDLIDSRCHPLVFLLALSGSEELGMEVGHQRRASRVCAKVQFRTVALLT